MQDVTIKFALALELSLLLACEGDPTSDDPDGVTITDDGGPIVGDLGPDETDPDGGGPLPDGSTPPPDGGQPPGSDGGTPEPPTSICDAPLGLYGMSGSRVVGSGSPGGCTRDALQDAVSASGLVTFDCGPDPVVIPIDEEVVAPWNRDTVIDGGGLVTLDGHGSSRILAAYGTNWKTNRNKLVIQRLALVNGRAPEGRYVAPNAGNPECAYGYAGESGGAVYVVDTVLEIIDSRFVGNEAPLIGPDVGGGAIFARGSRGVVVVGSHFENNRASNGGAIGAIHCSPDVYNSTFIDNLAEGIGGNEAGHTGCPGVGHEGQGGAGGLDGALYADGPEVDARETVLCGNRFVRNRANTLAGVIFRTPNRGVATGYRMRIDRCDFEDNSSALGGVSFIKDNVVTVRGSTFRGNRAGRRNDGSSVSGRFGGLWVNNGSFDVENSTFFDNLPLGLTVESGSGQVRNATLVGTPWNGNVTVRNGLIVNVSCGGASGGASTVQWPSGSACVNGAMFRDPGLGELGMHGGPTPTFVPSNAEGLAVGSDCPERDQRGAVRSGCVVGAVDPG